MESELDSPKLPLFSVQPKRSQEASGSLTPPLYSSVSVPFRWEEEPGKPRPCTDLITLPNPNDISQKCLELQLPPRLLLEKQLPSPTTVLEGPYVGRSKFHSSSFRMGMECYGNFSPERGELGALVLTEQRVRERGWFDSLGKVLKGKRDVGGPSYVFPSSVDGESDSGGNVGEKSSSKVKRTKIIRVGSFSSLAHAKPNIWATICQGLKQAVPWKSKKFKKDGIVI